MADLLAGRAPEIDIGPRAGPLRRLIARAFFCDCDERPLGRPLVFSALPLREVDEGFYLVTKLSSSVFFVSFH
jgi:hypothetical protein